ncbi:hypothetical protein R84B8_03260 [Treponema sp. R8-4-B8]
MKNMKSNVGSFATAKFQVIRLCLIVTVAVIGFSMVSCKEEDDPPVINLSLNGVWTAMGGGLVTTISGSSGTLTSIGVSSALWQDAVSKGYVKVGSQYFRNLTSTGTLTWSGQVLGVQYYTPNVAAGTSWLNCTITMSSNGQTFTDGSNTYTRQ